MVNDAAKMLKFLKRDDFDELVYRALELHAGIRHKNKSAVVCDYDVAHGDQGLKEALLAQAWENVNFDFAGEVFFLDEVDFSLPLTLKTKPFKNQYCEDNDNGRMCIERNDVYLAVRQAADDLQDSDENEEEEEEEEEE